MEGDVSAEKHIQDLALLELSPVNDGIIMVEKVR
jgi:hypothetical protein